MAGQRSGGEAGVDMVDTTTHYIEDVRSAGSQWSPSPGIGSKGPIIPIVEARSWRLPSTHGLIGLSRERASRGQPVREIAAEGEGLRVH